MKLTRTSVLIGLALVVAGFAGAFLIGRASGASTTTSTGPGTTGVVATVVVVDSEPASVTGLTNTGTLPPRVQPPPPPPPPVSPSPVSPPPVSPPPVSPPPVSPPPVSPPPPPTPPDDPGGVA